MGITEATKITAKIGVGYVRQRTEQDRHVTGDILLFFLGLA